MKEDSREAKSELMSTRRELIISVRRWQRFDLVLELEFRIGVVGGHILGGFKCVGDYTGEWC